MKVGFPEKLEQDASLYNERLQGLFLEAAELSKSGDAYGCMAKLDEISEEGISVSKYEYGLVGLRFPRLVRFTRRIPTPVESESVSDWKLWASLPFCWLTIPVKSCMAVGMQFAFKMGYERYKAGSRVDSLDSTYS